VRVAVREAIQMPVNLHQGCRQRLVKALVEGPPKITADNGMFLGYGSCLEGLLAAERVIPTTRDLRNRLIAYVDDFR
jgi:hypothetical protein